MEETNSEVQSINNKKIYKIIGLIVLLILAGCAFYFFYWVKTPQYSLKLIQESVQNHDVVALKRIRQIIKLLIAKNKMKIKSKDILD